MPTHGSLTKAGKVRFLKQLFPSWREVRKKTDRGLVIRKFRGKKSKCPRVKNRRKYELDLLSKR